jgi:hypothetical protein
MQTNMTGFKAISLNVLGRTDKNQKKKKKSGYLVFGLECNSELPEYGKIANRSTPTFGDIYVNNKLMLHNI